VGKVLAEQYWHLYSEFEEYEH